MTQLAPSILAADFGHLASEVQACEQAGAQRLHVDVMDNHFVPNLTMGPDVVAACRRACRLPIEVHLMVERPDGILPAFVAAGAGLLTVHYEACPQLHRSVELVRRQGARVGVGINPATPVASLVDILPEVDLALVMSVDPGFGGQDLLPSSLGKVRRLVRLLEEMRLSCEVELDGGVDAANAAECARAGATVLVAGTAVFHAEGGTGAGVTCLLERLRGASGGAA